MQRVDMVNVIALEATQTFSLGYQKAGAYLLSVGETLPGIRQGYTWKIINQ